MTSRYIIYGLTDPRHPEEFRYVGLSSSGFKRPSSHKTPSSIRNNKNRHLANWVQSLLNDDLVYDILVIEDCLERLNLPVSERKWIKHYRDLGHRLTNLSEGGDGWLGFPRSPEIVEKMRVASLNRERSPEEIERFRQLGASWKGKTRSRKTKKRISEAKMGHSVSEETREKISKANIGKIVSEEICEKMKVAARERFEHPFRELTTGQIFKTQSEAAEALDLFPNSICLCLQGKKNSTGGFQFSYDLEAQPLSKEELRVKRSQHHARPFKELTTGQVFQIQKEAARKLGIAVGPINQCLLGNKDHAGPYQFSYDLESKPAALPTLSERLRVHKAKPFRELTTGQVFQNQAAAVIALKVNSGGLSQCLNGKIAQVKGYRFEYINSAVTPPASDTV